MALTALNRDERREQQDRPGEPEQRARRAPPDVDCVNHRVHEQREACRDGHSPGNVKAFSAIFRPALEQQPGGEHRRGNADRDVHEQHPAPAQPAGENAAQQDSGGPAGAGDGTPDAQCPVALRAFGERGRDDR